MKAHSKHEKLVRPVVNNEWSITGTNCEAIKQLAAVIIGALSYRYRCLYVDSSHKEEDLMPGMLANGATAECIHHVNYAQINIRSSVEDSNLLRGQAYLVLVNGNHHIAARQIIVVDEKKKASLQKRMENLQQVELILLAPGNTELFDFLKEEYARVPVLNTTDTEKIIDFFKTSLHAIEPPVFGLVLAGGRSLRMGSDKTVMHWHGREQRYFLADAMQELCDEVFISCRPEQLSEVAASYPALPDTFSGLGPYGAILSAFRHNPNAAWMVIAADLPLLNKQTLEELLAARNASSMATAFAQPGNGKPEPLIAIWEPKAYETLLHYLGQGYSCPKKVLEKSQVTLIAANRPDELMNVNTPEEKEVASALLQKQKHLMKNADPE